MLAEKVKNGFQSQVTRTALMVAATMTVITSAFYVGQRVTHIEETIIRIEEKQIRVLAKLDQTTDQINGHEKAEGHPALVEKVVALKERVTRLER